MAVRRELHQGEYLIQGSSWFSSLAGTKIHSYFSILYLDQLASACLHWCQLPKHLSLQCGTDMTHQLTHRHGFCSPVTWQVELYIQAEDTSNPWEHFWSMILCGLHTTAVTCKCGQQRCPYLPLSLSIFPTRFVHSCTKDQNWVQSFPEAMQRS